MSQVSAITQVLSRAEDAGSSGRQGKYTLAPDVVLVLVEDGTSRLLDMNHKFYGLPAIGTSMLSDTLRHGSEEAARHIASEYGVPIERVRADLNTFLHTLEGSGLVEAPGRSGGWVRWLVTQAFLGPARLVKFAGARLPEPARIWVLLTATRLSLVFLGWARTIAIIKDLFPKPECPRGQEHWARAVSRIDSLVRRLAAGHPLALECKERAVCCWTLLRVEGWPSELVVGVDLFPFLGHCWCESGIWTLSDDPHRCERFVPVLRYR
jgi:hypothetical protein